jgi:molybdopterin-containing oxidoreductase family iron-sulfur binding subunit
MIACAVENNVPPASPKATERTGITWMRVERRDNGADFPESRTVFVPMTCQQCDHHTPCVSVCPQNAVELDPATGIVGQIPVRCLGCRYCMAACPYHARYFNWSDPAWPEGMEKALNPEVSVRMRGVVEKCNFCHHRLQAAKAKAAAEGRKVIGDEEYVPACVDACPAQAIVFGDLANEDGRAARLSRDERAFRMLERLGTEPKVYYRSSQAWVKAALTKEAPTTEGENIHG